MEHRWNHEIPDEYFLDPRYNAQYAPSLNRQDSELSSGTSRSTDSYSSYSTHSPTESPTHHEQLQLAGGHVHANHHHQQHQDEYAGSSSASTSRSPTASTRHASTSSASSSSYSARERFYCENSDCYDKHGRRSSFSRRADLNRHYQSVHGSVLHDCPWPRCGRRNEHGFPRLDHLIEHQRGYHHENIPKRGPAKGAREGYR